MKQFTSTAVEKEIAIKFSRKNDSNSFYKTNKIFSVIFTIVNLFKDNWVSNGVNISEEGIYPREKEIVFLPFSFYYIKDVYIDNNNYWAEIYLETIGKYEILEEKIKLGKEIKFKKNDRLMIIK